MEVERVSDRTISLKLEIEGVNIVSAYAPHVMQKMCQKRRWNSGVSAKECLRGKRVVIGAGFSGHVGERSRSN